MRPVLHCFTVWHELTQIILSEFFLYISQIKSIEFRTLWQIHYTRLRASDPIDRGLVFGQSRYICFCAWGFRTWPSIPAVRTPPTASVQRSPPLPYFIAANPVNRWCTRHQSSSCIVFFKHNAIMFASVINAWPNWCKARYPDSLHVGSESLPTTSILCRLG